MLDAEAHTAAAGFVYAKNDSFRFSKHRGHAWRISNTATLDVTRCQSLSGASESLPDSTPLEKRSR